MRRPGPALLILAAVLLSTAPAGALGREKPWFGGVYSGFSGFSHQSDLPAAEYLTLGLFAEPLAIPVLNPAIGVGLLLPLSPATDNALRLQFVLDLTLFDVPVRFLKDRFYLSSRWSPGVAAECLVPFDFASARFGFWAAPLRARLGDGTFEVAAAALLLDQEGRLRGWGITLFKASLFLF